MVGGGEMGVLTRAYDWSANPLGPPESWPQSLRTAVRILLNTNHPMFIWWGEELIQFYNDAYCKTWDRSGTRARSVSAGGNAGPRYGISSDLRSSR